MRRTACQRCRTKRLKCDSTKPCLNCRRANATCIAQGLDLQGSAPLLRPAREKQKPAVLDETSILELSKSLLDDPSCLPRPSISSAIPGGYRREIASSDFDWRRDVPYNLPEQNILQDLMTQYFNSVNWFMHVVDEESFREGATQQLARTTIPHTRRNFSLLLSLVWGLGAHYLWTNPTAPHNHKFLAAFRQNTFQYVESNILFLMSNPDLESVQIGILLGSFHLFNGQPNLGFGIMGSTIKAAQLLGLHRGFCGHSADSRSRDACAKVWWALEIFEKYAAIAFGRPCGINDSDCNVPPIQDSFSQSTQLTYQQEKCRLYRIVGTFLGRRMDSRASGPIQDIHRDLQAWFSKLPPDLAKAFAPRRCETGTLAEMQALALQLTYDNIQIVIHRHAVFERKPSDTQDDQSAVSIEQLVESALRTALAPNNIAIVPISQSSHAAMHAGICLFTAGVVVAALYLAGKVHTQRVDELMPALERIVSFLKAFPGQQYSLAAQSSEILQILHARCVQPSTSGGQLNGEGIRDELAESILDSAQWPNDEFSSFHNLNELSATELLDIGSGTSLDGIAQSWLWAEM